MGATVRVKCFNGKVFDLDFLESDTVPELQQKIAKESGIETARQTLLFKGKLLEGDGTLSGFSVTDGSTINVAVRRGVRGKQSSVGKSGKESGVKESGRKKSEAEAKKEAGKKADNAPSSKNDETKAGDEESGKRTALEDIMRRMNLNAGAESGAGMGGMGGLGGTGGGPAMGGGTWMEQAARSMGAPGAAGGKKFVDQFMSVMPQMMDTLWKSPEMKEYLEDPAKQEASRKAIMKNLEEAPFMKDILEEDPEFKRILEDPHKWQESMNAARALFQAQNPPSMGQNGSMPGRSGSTEAKRSQPAKDAPSRSSKEAIKIPKRQTAADVAPPTINIAKLSESYGHALGQNLMNSGLGLDPDLVIAGLQNACKGKDFPMQLSTYEKQMSQLQQVAAEFISKANLEDANSFFEETEKDPAVKTIRKGKVMYQPGELAPETDKPSATKDSTVLVILQGRLLDDRYFFTCPAADESGDTVHPLTLPLASAPPALRDGIMGMRETEERTLFVHPTATEGMQEMFGELLPPNALLIFDLELVSADAPPEEAEASKAAAMAGASSVKA